MAEDKISVVARIRPVFEDRSPDWTKNGERNIVKRDGTEIYTFDEVFDQLCMNTDIYDQVMKGMVDSALAGFNTAVCAYGQSGAGKTHTLTGSNSEDGVVQCTFQALFDTIAKSEDRNYMLRISYIEIYNEKVRDLLSEHAVDLPIYENKDGVAQIEGLKEVVVTEMSKVEELLEQAQEHRQLGETLLNERSSRSHTIIRLTIESHEVKLGGNATRCSIMNLVDLAGSENAAAAGTQGLRQKEGANINKSLLALSKVVSSLADNQKFIPYRDSKLTRILKPSLGGNSKTVIICCVNPLSVAETSSTLKFAKQAKKIVTRPVVNEVNDDGLLAKYLRKIEVLKQELEKTKTKKESDEEEMVREQRTKLAELMKGILNGRGTTETTAYLSRKARRQTWAPGNDLPFLNRRGSLSPPCKKERALGSIEECGGQASDEKIQSTGMDTGEKASSVFLIPNFIPSGRRSITKTDIEVQTLEPYPEDRSDEVATLKKGNAYLVEQLSTKTKHCKELEEQREEFANEFESLKAALGRMQDVETGALILEKQLEDMKRENAKFSEEVVALRKENASLKTCMMENESNPADRTRLIHRIDELHEELCETRKSASQAKSDLSSTRDELEQVRINYECLRKKLSEVESSSEDARHQYASASQGWKEEKHVLLEKIEKISASTMKDADSLALEREREIESLKEALATARKEIEAAVNAQENIKRQFEEQYLAAMAASEEELHQLRKDNADLRARINALLHSSDFGGSEEEVTSLKEEIAELKDIIERKNKALEVAKTHKDELEMSHKTIDRLSREKKELSSRLKMKTENTELLSSRINALRDEINEKQVEVAKAQKEKKLAEAAQEKFQEDNVKLLSNINTLQDEYTKYRAGVSSEMNEKNARIIMLQEQVRSSQHKIIALDTDLGIAQKDVERYKNAISSMTKAQEAAHIREHEEGHLRNKLNVALEDLESMKRAKEEAEEKLNNKEKMLGKAMDTITKLELASQSSEWLREKACMTRQIEDLQGELRETKEALEQASTMGKREERKRLADEVAREQSERVNASRASISSSLPEIAKLKQDLEDLKSELSESKEKNRRYRMQKINGIQYVDELKGKIAKMENDLKKAKGELTEKNEELQKALRSKAQLEAMINEKENQSAKGYSKPTAMRSKERNTLLNEEPECKQQ
ncbi:hypothetical protein V3C99_010188 [Haemonchus contortus]